MIKRTLILISLFSSLPLGLLAQENLQTYTPSILFDMGEWEFKSFQNLYTQTKAFGEGPLNKEPINGGRQTYFTSINQFLYGVNDQLNLGLDVWVKHVNYEDGSLNNRTAITGFGPKIKIAPFKNLKRLSIQSTFLWPLEQDLEAPLPDEGGPYPFLETDKSLWLTQFYYDKPISNKLQLFFQQAFWMNFVRDSFRENNFLQTQTSGFLSYFPTNRWTLYGMVEYFPTHYNDQEQSFEAFNNYFVQSGLGAKYQLIPQFVELELLYTSFWAGSEGAGAGNTFNLGIRLIRQ
jgi:hypothetical protein